MKQDDFRIFAEYYDTFYLKRRKDYEKEAKILKDIIGKSRSKKSGTLLDVGCGTGEHLKHLSLDFDCTGLDINRRMIEMAKSKVPDAEFQVANMMDFRFRSRFDVIICLFSSIGYVQSFYNLVKTLENFFRHLNDTGLVIVEPWVFKKDFKKGHISLDTIEEDELKFVRMARSRISGSTWFIYMHYLVGKNEEIKHFSEVHKMLALDHQDYVEAFKSSGFKGTRYLTENLWDGCRGLFTATK
jgi:ubiquinone/menaquinone biosynthesis C-methylase UbiE